MCDFLFIFLSKCIKIETSDMHSDHLSHFFVVNYAY
ncbi:hypothetical protein IMSAGC020_00288 [Lachnospiraceae bacterium]|nr:hypothetical protein IMSAGC020_00288 [Lachnospiraceae bacterium]